MSRVELGFRRLVAYTMGGVALLAFALFLRAQFMSQSQTAARVPGLGVSSIGTTFPEPGDDIAPAWSSDNRYLAYVSVLDNSLTLYVRDLQTNATTPIARSAYTPVWSPVGLKLAYLRLSTGGPQIDLYVTDPDGLQHVRVNDVPDPAGEPLWMPDGESLLFSAPDSSLHIVSAGGQPVRTIQPVGMTYFMAAQVSPDGARTLGMGAGANGVPDLFSVDLRSGQAAPLGVSAAGFGALAPDGEHIAFIAPDPNPSLGNALYVFSPDSPPLRLPGIDPGEVVGQYAWSSDSRLIAYTTGIGFSGGKLIVARVDASLVAAFPFAQVSSLAWSPDGSQMGLSVKVGEQYDIAIIPADEASLLARLASLEPTPAPDPFQVTYVSTESSVHEVIWSPDGQRIAFTSGDHSALHVRDLATNEVVLIAENVWHPAWSPDGAQLAYADNASFDLYVADAQGQSRQKVEGARDESHALWSPDSQSLLYTMGDAAIYAYSVTAQTVERIPIRGLEWFRGYSLSPDRERVLGIGGVGSEATPGAMYLVDWRTGRASNSWGDMGVQDARLSPNGEYIAFTVDSAPGAIRVVRTGGGEVRVITAPNRASIGPFTWSPDSRFVAFTTFFPMASYFEPYVVRLDDGQLIPLLPDSSVDALAWSPDEAHIALAVNWDKNQNRGIGIVRADEASLTARQAAPAPAPTPTPVPPLAPSPSTTPAPTATPLPFPTLFPTPTPLHSTDFYWPTRLTNDPTGNYRPAVSPDGQRIAFASERDGNWDIYVLDRSSGAETRLTDDPDPDMAPSWSPDGARIAYQHNILDPSGPVLVDRTVMNADGLNKTVVASGSVWTGNQPPAWSPDGMRIAFNDSRHVVVVNVDERREVARFTPPDVQAYLDPAWFDDSQVAFSGDGQLTIGDLSSGAVIAVDRAPRFARLPMTTRAYPRIGYFALEGSSMRLITVLPNGDEPHTLVQISVGLIQQAAWSPDGRFIAYYADDSVYVAIAWGEQYRDHAPLFAIPNVTSGLSDLVGLSWLPGSSGFVYVASSDGQPDLFLATLNQEAIQAYVDSYPLYAPRQVTSPEAAPPPPPAMTPPATPTPDSPPGDDLTVTPTPAP